MIIRNIFTNQLQFGELFTFKFKGKLNFSLKIFM